MKIVLLVASILLSIIQIAICYFWTESNVDAQFSSSINSLYGEVPVWTILAFSFGKWWYLVAFTFLVVTVSAFIKQVSKRYVVAAFLLPFAGVICMIYAMYPIHLMLLKSVV